MRYLALAFSLLILPALASAGSIRPAAVTTTAAEDVGLRTFIKDLNATTCVSVGLPKTCTDAEAKAVNPALTIYTTNGQGYQDYSQTYYSSAVHDHAARGIALKTAKDLSNAYLAASPATQAQVDALLGIQ